MTKVYTRIIFCCLITMTVFQSCKDEDRNALFSLFYSMDVSIPPGLNTFETHFFSVRNIPTNFVTTSTGAGVDPETVQRINTVSARLYSEFGNDNLSIVEEAIVDIYPVNNPSGIGEAAYTIHIPFDGLSSIDLIGSLNNLVDVLKEDQVTFEIQLRFRAVTQSSMDLTFDIRFDTFE